MKRTFANRGPRLVAFVCHVSLLLGGLSFSGCFPSCPPLKPKPTHPCPTGCEWKSIHRESPDGYFCTTYVEWNCKPAAGTSLYECSWPDMSMQSNTLDGGVDMSMPNSKADGGMDMK